MNTNQQVRCNVKKETDGLLQSILDKVSNLPSTAYDEKMLRVEKVRENCIKTLEQQQTGFDMESEMYRKPMQNFNEQLQLLKELQELERQISDAHIKRDMLQQNIDEIQRRLLLLEKQKDIFCNVSPEPTELRGIRAVENKLNLRRQNADLELQKLDQLQHKIKEVMDKLNAIIQEQLKFIAVQMWPHFTALDRTTAPDLTRRTSTISFLFTYPPGWKTRSNANLIQAAFSTVLIYICLLITATILLGITHDWPTSLEQQVQKCLNSILLSSGDVERNPGPRRMTGTKNVYYIFVKILHD